MGCTSSKEKSTVHQQFDGFTNPPLNAYSSKDTYDAAPRDAKASPSNFESSSFISNTQNGLNLRQAEQLQITKEFVEEKLAASGINDNNVSSVSWHTNHSPATSAEAITFINGMGGISLDVKITPKDNSQVVQVTYVHLNGEKLFSRINNNSKSHRGNSMKSGASAKLKIYKNIPASVLEKASSVTSTSNTHSSRRKKAVGFVDSLEEGTDSVAQLREVSTPTSSSKPNILTTSHSKFVSQGVSPIIQQTSTRPLFTRGSIFGKMKSIRSPSDRAELIVLGEDNDGEEDEDTDVPKHNCKMCHLSKEKGAFCDSLEHFICHDCFANHVEALCRDTHTFKTSKSAVSCPCGGCTSAPWNSYHMRKILTNGHDAVLELYLSTMMMIMQELSLHRTSGLSPSPNRRGMGNTPVMSRQTSKRQPDATHDQGDHSASTTISMPPAPSTLHIAANIVVQQANVQPVQPIIIHFTDDEMRFEFEKLKETIKILRKQLIDHNIDAAEYIPLEDIQSELQEIFAKANHGEEYDEGRMDFLLMCLENNPDYIAKKEEEQRQWREENLAFARKCYDEMLAYIPPDIFSAPITRLKDEYKFSAEFSKRLMSKKCLWLLRCEKNDIEKLHEADLMGRFTFEAQGLDIVELGALFAAIPEKFSSDSTGRKQNWRNNLEFSLKKLMADKAQGRLEKNKTRNPVYNKETPKFVGDLRMHRLRDEFTPTINFEETSAHRLASLSGSSIMNMSQEDLNRSQYRKSPEHNPALPRTFSLLSPEVVVTSSHSMDLQDMHMDNVLHFDMNSITDDDEMFVRKEVDAAEPKATIDITMPVLSKEKKEEEQNNVFVANGGLEQSKEKIPSLRKPLSNVSSTSSMMDALNSTNTRGNFPTAGTRSSQDTMTDTSDVTETNVTVGQNPLAVAAAAVAASMAARRRASLEDQAQ